MTGWWNGWNDRTYEGKWISHDMSQLNDSKIQSWAEKEPNGGTKENCALSYLNEKMNKVEWYDAKCNYKLPALCEVPRKEGVFVLRGKMVF